MSHTLRKSATPSSTLLKFLRAQKDGVPFFTPNSSFRTSAAKRCPVRHEALSTPARRSMATCALVPSPLESSFSVLENLWPRRPLSLKAEQSTTSSVPVLLLSRSGPSCFERDQRAQYSQGYGKHLDAEKYQGNAKGQLSRWWGFKKNRSKTALQPGDLPPIAGFLDDNVGLGRSLRPGDQLMLRCTEFDENGNVTLVNGEFKKSELIAKYGLLPRDLRKVDSSLLPNILVRPSAILINLLHLRALIKHDRVLVLDAYGSTDSYTQSLFMYDLENKLRTPASPTAPGALPYEFRALEAVLISVTSALEGEFEGVREPVVRVLRELEEDIDRDKLRHLLIYSKKLGTFEQKARLVRDAIDDLLEADDDLAALYLSEKARGAARDEDDHTEIEMLLESYHKVCDEIVQVSGNLVSNIRNTEEIVKAILDANRNSLMLLDLKFSIGTLGMAGGTFVAALYGMNLKNFIEDSDLAFWGVSAWCSVVTGIVCVWGLRRLRRVQRLSMWGGSDGSDRTRGKSGWARLGRGVVGGGSGGELGGGVGVPAEPLMPVARRERLRGAARDVQHLAPAQAAGTAHGHGPGAPGSG